MPPTSRVWFPLLRGVVQGAGVTLGSTLVSCALALQMEASAHRLLYRLQPTWYHNVNHAYGLTDDQLLRAKQMHHNNNASFQPEPQTHNDKTEEPNVGTWTTKKMDNDTANTNTWITKRNLDTMTTTLFQTDPPPLGGGKTNDNDVPSWKNAAAHEEMVVACSMTA